MEVTKTRDLYEAAFLKVSGLKLLESVREEHRVMFCFESTDELKKLRTAWMHETATVNASNFSNAIKGLKNLVHSL